MQEPVRPGLLHLERHEESRGEQHQRRDHEERRVGEGREEAPDGRTDRPPQISADPQHGVVFGSG